MTIATAQPTEEEKQGIPHHLIAFLDPSETYSVAQYVDDAKKCIAATVVIWYCGKYLLFAVMHF